LSDQVAHVYCQQIPGVHLDTGSGNSFPHARERITQPASGIDLVVGQVAEV
jgi:hypothetical protein